MGIFTSRGDARANGNAEELGENLEDASDCKDKSSVLQDPEVELANAVEKGTPGRTANQDANGSSQNLDSEEKPKRKEESRKKEKSKCMDIDKDPWHLAKNARGWSPEDSRSCKDVCSEELACGSESRADVWRKAVRARGWEPEEGSAWPDESDEPVSRDGVSSYSASSAARSTISMLLNIFSSPGSDQGEEEPPPSPELEELRRAVLRAEAAGANSELLEHVRAKLEELEAELARDVKVHVVNGMSGELAAVVRARPCDTAFRLKEAILSEGIVNSEEDGLCSINFLHCNQLMDESITLAEAGIRDGDQVQLVRSPLRCLTASLDGTVRLWQLDSKATDETNPFKCFREEEALDNHGPVLSASLTPDGRSLLTVAAGGEGQLWCAETGRAVAELEGASATGQFCPDGQRVVGSSTDEAARIWCANTGKCLHTLQGHTGEVRAARFSPDGSMALTGAGDGTAALWAASTGERIATLEGHSDVVKSVDFSPDGQMAVTASGDGTARAWAVPSGKLLQVFRGHSKAISSVKFSPDGDRILTASAFDGTARLWDVATASCSLVIPGDGKVVNDAVFSPDGQKVLLASASDKLRVFGAEDGECVLTLQGHEDWVRSAAFSPDGTIIGSASYDGTVRLWSVTGKCLKVLEGHDGAVISVAFIEG